MKFRRLTINGKFLGAKPTGVHRVAYQLIQELGNRYDELGGLFEEKPVIIAPPNVGESHDLPFPVERGGIFRGQLWEQLDLPRLTSRDLLLNFCNLGPMASTAAITMIHDAQVFITPESYSWAFARWYRLVLPIVGRRHLRILAVSEFSASQLAWFDVARQDRISVIPNGVDHLLSIAPDGSIVDRLKLAPRKYVVGLANTQVHKNIGLLLQAFSDPAIGKTKLVLVGKAERAEFEALGHSVPPNVIFAGRLDDGEFRGLLEEALCVAFPSTTEGFGLPPLEGMTFGCPAIMAPCGALPEVGGDAVIYGSPDKPGEWVAAVNNFREDEAVWGRYSAEGRKRAGLFTWAEAGRKLVASVKLAVDQPGP